MHKTLKKTLTIWTYIINIKMFFILESPKQNTGYEKIFSLNQEVTSKRICVIFLVKHVPRFLTDSEIYVCPCTHFRCTGAHICTRYIWKRNSLGVCLHHSVKIYFSSKLLIYFNNPTWHVESILL